MQTKSNALALIVGAGSGLSASLARKCAAAGMRVALAARNIDKLKEFPGASASVKGYAESAPFVMGKFALRGLAQSLARELGPKNIHVAHFVIDGGILRAGGDSRAGARGEDGMLHPDAIAQTYLDVYR